MKRLILPLAAAVLALWLAPGGQPRPAQADDGTGGTTGTSLTGSDFRIELYFLNQKDEWEFLNETNRDLFFNRARCECDTAVRVRVDLLSTGRAKLASRANAKLQVKAGTNDCVCTSDTCGTRCIDLGAQADVLNLVNNTHEVTTTAGALFQAGFGGSTDAGTSSDACGRQEKQAIWLWVDSDDDVDLKTDLTDATLQFNLDGRAPPAPGGLRARGGNEALLVDWADINRTEDFESYVVLCSRGGDSPVFKAGTFSPKYRSAAGICPGKTSAALVETSSAALADTDGGADAAGGAGGTGGGGASGGSGGSNPTVAGGNGELFEAPAPIRRLDPAFVCSNMLTGGETSHRIFRLQNEIPYLVGVASVDRHGNASAIEQVILQRPFPTRDFYRDYREQGGADLGGYCAVGGRGGWHFSWLALGLPLVALAWRRLRRPRR